MGRTLKKPPDERHRKEKEGLSDKNVRQVEEAKEIERRD